MYKKMLVPLDGSERAEVVFPYTKELAGRLGLDIVLFLVSRPSAQAMMPMQKAYIEQALERVKNQITEIQQSLKPVPEPVNVQSQLIEGYPPDEILHYADENEMDLILMATHGQSGGKR